MDRGIPTEEVLAEMRSSAAPVYYLVGTPRGRLGQMAKQFLPQPWSAVRDTVQVKLVEQDGELYVLARSGMRRDKEQAMRRRRLNKLVKRLHELRQQKLTRDQLLLKLGAAKKEAGPAIWRSLEIELPDKDQPVTSETLSFRLNWQRLREARRREGSYLLRSNLTDRDPGAALGILSPIGGSGAGLQRAEERSGGPADLPPDRGAHRSAHLCRLPRVLPAGHAEAAVEGFGGGTDAARGAGEDGSHPDGRCAPAHD